MNLTIARNSRGLEITNGDEKLIFRNKLFSLSSEITDENGDIIATLKRKGWWYLTFSLTTKDGEYELLGKWGEFQLISNESNEVFNTNSSIEFYNAKGIRVTEFKRSNDFGSQYLLNINNTEHALAFIMASCIFYKTTMESSGIAAG